MIPNTTKDSLKDWKKINRLYMKHRYKFWISQMDVLHSFHPEDERINIHCYSELNMADSGSESQR